MGVFHIRILWLLALTTALGLGSQDLKAHETKAGENAGSITLRSGSSAWTYQLDQLVAMATESIPNQRGNRGKPSISLEKLLLKDTRLTPDKVAMVFFIGNKITVLRGNDIAYLSRLVLANGPDKDGKPHHWALAPKDQEAYRALAPHMGATRKPGIYRIDIVRKQDVSN
jgi:hypothetical protein